MGQAKRVRRRHSAEFKQQVLAECDRPGAAVAAVALSHGVNANLVHKWRRQQRMRPANPS
jgi:transposase